MTIHGLNSSRLMSWINTKIPSKTQATSFQTSLAQVTASSAKNNATPSDVGQLDFKNMTLGEMGQWIDQQVRSNNLTFEQIGFLGSLAGIQNVDGSPVDLNTRYDFVARAQGGVDAGMIRGDVASAKYWQDAVNYFMGLQGQSAGIDTMA